MSLEVVMQDRVTGVTKNLLPTDFPTGQLKVNGVAISESLSSSQLNVALPTQTSHATHALITDGSGNLSWAARPAEGNHGDVSVLFGVWHINSGAIDNLNINASAAIDWSKLSKTGSSLADLATRNFSDLQSKPTTVPGYGITDAATLPGDNTFTGANTFATGVIVESEPLSITQSWLDSEVVFKGLTVAIADTASDSTSSYFEILGGASATTAKFRVDDVNTLVSNHLIFGNATAGAISVVGDPYAASWNGSVYVPTKNDIYDKIEALLTAPTLTGAITIAGETSAHGLIKFLDAESTLPFFIEHRNGVNNATDQYNTDLLFGFNAYMLDGTGVQRVDGTKPGGFFQFENNWPNGVGAERLNEINWTTIGADGSQYRAFNFVNRTDDVTKGVMQFFHPLDVSLSAAAMLGGTGNVANFSGAPPAGYRANFLFTNTAASPAGISLTLKNNAGTVHWLAGVDRTNTNANSYFIYNGAAGRDAMFLSPAGGTTIGNSTTDAGLNNLKVVGTITSGSSGIALTDATGKAVPGATTGIQAYDADLTTWAGITPGTGVAASLAIANNTAGGYSPIDGAATLTNKVSYGLGGGGAMGGTSGAVTLTASGTNQSITLTPSGTGQVLGPNGAIGTPAYSHSNFTSSGWYAVSAGDYRLSLSATDRFRITASGIVVAAGGLFNFASSGVSTVDVAVSRNGAGLLEINSGTALAYRDLILRNLVLDTTTGTKLGTATTGKLGFWNATPVVQPTAVDDPDLGAIIDVQARVAIAALLARLRTIGIIAT